MRQNDNPPSGHPPPESDPRQTDIEIEALQRQLQRTLGSSVPPEKLPAVRRIISRYIHKIEEHYSGPLPHPRHLEHFERTLPGSAERILTMAEKEQRHRHGWEDKQLSASTISERMGLFGGIVVAVALIAGAVTCAFEHATEVAIALVAASAVSMVPAIIKGREYLNTSREDSE